MNSTEKGPLISALKRSLEQSFRPLEISGFTNPTLLAWVLSQDVDWGRPQLVVCSNSKMAKNFSTNFTAINPTRAAVSLPSFDESPYSGLYPSRSCLQSRTHFLWKAQKAGSNGVFVSDIEGLLQKTTPLELFKSFEV